MTIFFFASIINMMMWRWELGGAATDTRVVKDHFLTLLTSSFISHILFLFNLCFCCHRAKLFSPYFTISLTQWISKGKGVCDWGYIWFARRVCAYCELQLFSCRLKFAAFSFQTTNMHMSYIYTHTQNDAYVWVCVCNVRTSVCRE